MAMRRELGAALILALIASGLPGAAYPQNAAPDAATAGAKDEGLRPASSR